MLHHKVADFFSILVPPFLLVIRMVEVPLPFCCLNEVGWVLWVRREVDSWRLEFSNGQRGEQAVVLQAVCNMFGDGFNIEIEGGCCLGSPRVVKNNMLQPLRGRREQWFLWGEGAAWELRPSFNFWFLLGLGWFGSCHTIADRRLINKSGLMAAPFD